jgi:ribosomal protein L7/L12
MSLITEEFLRGVTQERKVNFSKGLSAVEVLNESFNINKTYDVFLSHSYIDKEKIASVKYYLELLGLSVYIDWIDDGQLVRDRVTKETAERIKSRMKKCKSLIYVFSNNSNSSKWMPWELGYFDGIKGRIAVLPITRFSNINTFRGTEYLGLYPYVTKDQIAGKDSETLWVRENENKYISIGEWLIGRNPFKRN